MPDLMVTPISMKSVTVALLVFISFVTVALAGAGFRVVDQDAAVTARSNAFTATADNPSAIYYNPAGITQLKGVQFRASAYSVSIRAESDAANGAHTENRSRESVVPQLFATWTPTNSPLSFGLGVYSPYGLAAKYPDDAPFRTAAKVAKIEYVAVNPVVAWQATRTLSLGIGATINYAETELSRGIMQVGDEFKLRAAGTSYGFNAGVLWQPTEHHSFGIRYHSGTEMELSGQTSVRTKSFTATTPLGPLTVPEMASKQDANANLRFPQFVTLGYSYRPAPGWNLEIGAEWTDWNALNELTVHRQGADTVSVPFHWRSNWIYQIGVTRSWMNGWHASLGYIYAEKVVPEETFTPAVPDYDRHVFTGGFGYSGKRWSFDLAYEYSHQPDRTISQGTTVDGIYRLDTHALSLSCGVKF